VALAIDVSTIAIPFGLLRPLLRAHEAGRSPNQQVAQDTGVLLLVALLGASVYAVTMYASLTTWLPEYIAYNFNDVRSFEKAHDANLYFIAGSLIPIGWSTAQFLFTPAIGSRGNPGLTDSDIYPEKVPFNPETATFQDHVAYNLGFKDGFSKRAEVLIKRTAVLVVTSVAHTFLRTWLTIDGTEPFGVLGWSSIWGGAALLTSVAYGLVANE
jgi:hypothetical protein